MQNKLRAIYFALGSVTLICGAAIYPLFRGPNLLVWKILPMPGFWEALRIPVNIENIFFSVLVYSGPDFLWLLSGIFFLRALFFFEQKAQTIYIVVLYLIAAGWNAGQFFGAIPGTFCNIDLLTMSGVALAEGIIYKVIKKRRIRHDEKKY
ncbi:MAG: hypothetical protein FWC36_02120 [Spirochaetes bacterium]|nr:hypothetical protein [Spirochaetota bacterium]